MNQVYEHPQRNNQVMQPGHIRPSRKEPRLAPYAEGLAAGVGDPNRASSSNIDQKSVHTDNDGVQNARQASLNPPDQLQLKHLKSQQVSDQPYQGAGPNAPSTQKKQPSGKFAKAGKKSLADNRS
jgi:hypothetical protein